VLDVSKLLATGVKMRPVQKALEDALRKWPVTATATAELTRLNT
jgi:hypothetical protein